MNDSIKATQIKEIADMLKVNSSLPPFLFEQNEQMIPFVREKLLSMTNFVQDIVFPFFNDIKVVDVLLNGSLCSYAYTQNSDLDIFIIIEDIVPNNLLINAKIFDNISIFFTKQVWKPSVYGHKVDFGFVTKNKYMRYYKDVEPPAELYSYASYSILNDKWIAKPLRSEYSFTAEDIYENYLQYAKDLQNFVDNLTKTPNGFLTIESIQELRVKIAQLKYDAFITRELGPEREYSMIYNTYRIAKRFKLFAQHYKYADDSFHFLSGGKK